LQVAKIDFSEIRFYGSVRLNGLAWLRAFNHLRVAAGEILGIEGDGWEDLATDATKQKPEYGILIALGYLQEELVAALDS
jgi:hypothetical protein